MFGSALLDVAIGMVFVFLLLSLICSAFNELLETRLKNRAGDLLRVIADQQPGFFLLDNFRNSAYTAGHDGNTRRHGEEDAGAESFAVRDVNKKSGAGEVAGAPGARERR